MSDAHLKASVKIKQVPKLCETRWSAHVMTLSAQGNLSCTRG